MHTPQPLTTDDTSEAKNIFSSDSLQELLNQIQFSPMMSNTVDDKPIAMMSNTVDDKPIDNAAADLLLLWLMITNYNVIEKC